MVKRDIIDILSTLNNEDRTRILEYIKQNRRDFYDRGWEAAELELKHYMVDNNHIVKSKAIVEILETYFTKENIQTGDKK